MNKFEREYWDGAREAALTVYSAVKGRSDVPEDVRRLALELLEETAARKNREFREALGINSPSEPRRGPETTVRQA
ncbi:MAG TPA: hypothetical protein VFF67_10415 [Thermoplasmata archaeon]|nr:hypothetical protein [Thermoplasmata archaeon]